VVVLLRGIKSKASRARDFPKRQRILAESAPGKEAAGSGGFFCMGEWSALGMDGAIMAIMVIQPKIQKSKDNWEYVQKIQKSRQDPRRMQY
jgi:heme exporter protein D